MLGSKLACRPFDTKGDPADAVPAANQMMSSANPVMVIGASDDAVEGAVTWVPAIVDRLSSIRQDIAELEQQITRAALYNVGD